MKSDHKLTGMHKYFISILFLGMSSLFFSCKEEWLDAKSSKSLVVPATIKDFQALLDSYGIMNGNYPGLGVVAGDNYYVNYTDYQGLSTLERNAYVWAGTDNFYDGNSPSDWSAPYRRILPANIVLEGAANIDENPFIREDLNNVKGSALFHRSLNFFCLAQVFCKPYQSTTAATDPGVVLRLTSDVNKNLTRSTIQQTYDQILNDLQDALPLLPDTTAYLSRPSKAAVYGLLARIYLSMEYYDKALLYSDSCLMLKNKLMDYNKLDSTQDFPVPRFNEEVIFQYTLVNYSVYFSNNRLVVDSTLYDSFKFNDLRKSIYFKNISGRMAFRGSYNNSRNLFGGLTTDEIYFTRAECYARAGKVAEALSDVNKVLQTRWKKNDDGSTTYTDIEAANEQEALSIVLAERRKELCFRGLRWSDLRRLNRDDRFKTTIVRSLNGETFSLLPNSPRYVFPLDDKEVLLGGLIQNIR